MRYRIQESGAWSQGLAREIWVRLGLGAGQLSANCRPLTATGTIAIPRHTFNQIMALLEASKECVKLWRERAKPLYIEVTEFHLF
jgi:hypothetical protein